MSETPLIEIRFLENEGEKKILNSFYHRWTGHSAKCKPPKCGHHRILFE